MASGKLRSAGRHGGAQGLLRGRRLRRRRDGRGSRRDRRRGRRGPAVQLHLRLQAAGGPALLPLQAHSRWIRRAPEEGLGRTASSSPVRLLRRRDGRARRHTGPRDRRRLLEVPLQRQLQDREQLVHGARLLELRHRRRLRELLGAGGRGRRVHTGLDPPRCGADGGERELEGPARRRIGRKRPVDLRLGPLLLAARRQLPVHPGRRGDGSPRECGLDDRRDFRCQDMPRAGSLHRGVLRASSGLSGCADPHTGHVG